MKKSYVILIALPLSLLFQSTQAEDRLDLEGTSIRGNRELPKVLYIAPWKKPGMSDLGRPLDSLVNEVMAPLERKEFQRQIKYYYLASEKDQKKQVDVK